MLVFVVERIFGKSNERTFPRTQQRLRLLLRIFRKVTSRTSKPPLRHPFIHSFVLLSAENIRNSSVLSLVVVVGGGKTI